MESICIKVYVNIIFLSKTFILTFILHLIDNWQGLKSIWCKFIWWVKSHDDYRHSLLHILKRVSIYIGTASYIHVYFLIFNTCFIQYWPTNIFKTCSKLFTVYRLNTGKRDMVKRSKNETREKNSQTRSTSNNIQKNV